jgi:hypothetical protein
MKKITIESNWEHIEGPINATGESESELNAKVSYARSLFPVKGSNEQVAWTITASNIYVDRYSAICCDLDFTLRLKDKEIIGKSGNLNIGGLEKRVEVFKRVMSFDLPDQSGQQYLSRSKEVHLNYKV